MGNKEMSMWGIHPQGPALLSQGISTPASPRAGQGDTGDRGTRFAQAARPTLTPGST